MPRRRGGIKLTFEVEDDLLLGGPPAAWRSERERREAWREHREKLMSYGGPGHRPAGWWDYEAGEDAPRDRPEGSWHDERDVARFHAHDLEQLRYVCERDMSAGEAVELVRQLSRRESAPGAREQLAAVLEFFPEADGQAGRNARQNGSERP